MEKSKTRKSYVLIKNLIIGRKLRPGIQLKEEEFSKQLNTSRTPIREAFKMLEKDGFVENIPNKGTYVVNPSIEDICYANELRVKYDEKVAELVIDNVTFKDIEILENYVDLEYKLYKDNKVLEYIETNKKFHLKIANLSGNKYLIDAIETIINAIDIHLLFYDNYSHTDIGNIDSIKQHRLIIKYLKEKNLEKLKKIMTKHVYSTCYKIQKNKENQF